MNQLKKLGALVLSVIMILSFAACGKKEEDVAKETANKEAQSETAPEQEAPLQEEEPSENEEDASFEEESSEEKPAEDENTEEAPLVEEEEEVAEATEVEKYIEENGETLMKEFIPLIEVSNGVTCKYTIKGSGNDVIAKIMFDEKDNLSDEEKAEIQDKYGSQTKLLAILFMPIKSEVPSLETVIIHLCEEDGDEIAVLNVEM